MVGSAALQVDSSFRSFVPSGDGSRGYRKGAGHHEGLCVAPVSESYREGCMSIMSSMSEVQDWSPGGTATNTEDRHGQTLRIIGNGFDSSPHDRSGKYWLFNGC